MREKGRGREGGREGGTERSGRHRVKLVSHHPDVLRLLGHLDDSSRIVGDGPEVVHGEDEDGGAEHAHGRGCGAEETRAGAEARGLAEVEGEEEGEGDDDGWSCCALVADRKAGDDVGAWRQDDQVRRRREREVGGEL